MSASARPSEAGAQPPAGRAKQGFRAAMLRACGAGRLCKAGPTSRSDGSGAQ